MNKLLAFLLLATVAQANTLSVTVGDPVTFSVSADGSEPKTYQLYFQNVGGSAQSSGMPTATPVWRIPSAKAADSGNYYAMVSNSAGTVKSDVSTLTVVPVAIPVTKATGTLEKK